MLEAPTPPASDPTNPPTNDAPPIVMDAPPRSPVGSGGSGGNGGNGGSGKKSHKKKPDPSDGPSSPPPPFVGGPPVDGADRTPAQETAARIAGAQKKVAQVAVDPKKAAESLVALVDGGFTMLASTRYGQLIEPTSGKRLVDLMAVTSDERDNLVEAVVLLMKASSVSMSPGLNLAMAAGMTYGIRAFALERARSASKAAASGTMQS